jgi:hypothetical protein
MENMFMSLRGLCWIRRVILGSGMLRTKRMVIGRMVTSQICMNWKMARMLCCSKMIRNANECSEPMWQTFQSLSNVLSVDLCWIR